MKLVINEEEAHIVKFIYESFLNDVPIYKIQEMAVAKGFSHTGNSSIHRLLRNPLYFGFQKVKPWKNNPGGLFPIKNSVAIIDAISWNRVQEKLRGDVRTNILLHEDIPLRGFLRCHCGRLMTGAASRGKGGRYYYYYRCIVTSKHNNISAIKMHGQLHDILKLISIPFEYIQEIRTMATSLMQKRTGEDKLEIESRKKELASAEKNLKSVEEKWINNLISQETYNRWYNDLVQKIANLKSNLRSESKDKTLLKKVLNSELEKLSDLSKIYDSSNVVDKRTLLLKVFNIGLIYENGRFRTPEIHPMFNRNIKKMRELNLLEITKKGIEMSSIPSGGGRELDFEIFISFLELINNINIK